jgi:hypothetical protein
VNAPALDPNPIPQFIIVNSNSKKLCNLKKPANAQDAFAGCVSEIDHRALPTRPIGGLARLHFAAGAAAADAAAFAASSGVAAMYSVDFSIDITY